MMHLLIPPPIQSQWSYIITIIAKIITITILSPTILAVNLLLDFEHITSLLFMIECDLDNRLI
jgi:hypothetical protein